jgi:alanyl-tRNA synthetase
VDYGRRGFIAPNHTMTHALNFALRKVVGADVDQKGSQVTDEKLRFDYNASRPMTVEEVRRVDDLVNAIISRARPVYTRVTPLADAQQIKTLRAVFGETYPDPVRVVSIGVPVEELLAEPEKPEWDEVSVEFCGGTHLFNTAKAEAFATIDETSISKGIRRIICVTRNSAKRALDRAAQLTRLASEAAGVKDPWAREQATTAVQAALDMEPVAYADRVTLRARLEDMIKAIKKEQKALLAQRASELADRIIAIAQPSSDSAASGAGAAGGGGGGGGGGVASSSLLLAGSAGDGYIVVSSGEVGSDAKAVHEAVARLEKADKSAAAPAPVPTLVLGLEPSVVVEAFVPAAMAAKGVTAEAWVAAAVAGLGYKVRAPRATNAVANGKPTDGVSDVIVANARAFAASSMRA